MRLSALLEREGIVSVSCVLRLVVKRASQKGLIVLGNLHRLGLPLSPLQRIYKESHSRDRVPITLSLGCLEDSVKVAKRRMLWDNLAK